MPGKKEYTVEAFYVGESIDLKKAEELLRRYVFLNRDHPLVLQFSKDAYVALAKFGVVVFWNVTGEDRRRFLVELSPFTKSQRPHYPYSESIEVFVAGSDKVSANGVYLALPEVDRIKLVSYAIAQSVALERYEEDAETHLGELEAVIANLKTAGRAMLRERALLKQVGRALAVKQTAISHLSLFDKPEEVWESPQLEKLYGALSAEFDLQARFSVLDKKIDFLSETSRTLIEILAERKSALLEIIIIVLIAIGLIPYAGDILRFLGSLFRLSP